MAKNKRKIRLLDNTSVYIKLGPKAISFYDHISTVKVLRDQIVKVDKSIINSCIGVKTAIAKGALIHSNKLEYNNFLEKEEKDNKKIAISDVSKFSNLQKKVEELEKENLELREVIENLNEEALGNDDGNDDDNEDKDNDDDNEDKDNEDNN